VTVHEFLSPGWIDAALAIRDEYANHLPEPPGAVRMNLIVSDAPGHDDAISASIDTADTGLLPRLGHLADPELTVKMDYETARTIFVEQKPEAVAQAFFSGRIAIDGDMTRLFFLQTLQPTDDEKRMAAEVHDRLVAITAPAE
jgi:hypothetical protein